MLRRASPLQLRFTDRIGPMKMSALLIVVPPAHGRASSAPPGSTATSTGCCGGSCPGDIVVLDVLDLDRITADALVDADIAAVINASPSISGRYPNLGPEVLVGQRRHADRRDRPRRLQEGQGRRQGAPARRWRVRRATAG